jgi:peptide deformylase
LAAPQVGKSIRVVVIDPSGGEKDPYILINPEVIYLSEETEVNEEGCLSLPKITLKVRRSSRVSVKALDQTGKEFIIENAEGLLARALQHEIDHLDGIMIIDHVSALQRKMLSGKLKKLAKG